MVQDVTLSALSLSEVIQRSLVRAVSAVKVRKCPGQPRKAASRLNVLIQVVQLVTAWLEEHDLAGQAGEDVVAGTSDYKTVSHEILMEDGWQMLSCHA